MNHEGASELLAALALDALDSSERQAVEEHVAQCRHCQSDVDALREVAGALGNTVEPLPETLWSNISSRIYEDRSETAPAPSAMSSEERMASITSRRRLLTSHFARLVAIPLGVAAVLVAVLVFQLVSADRQISRLQTLGAAANTEVAAALKAPGHQLIDLKRSTHQKIATFVMLPDGRGFLVTSKLPSLSSKETYQLWGDIAGKVISIGLMGRSPSHVTFTVSSTPRPSELAVTVEPSGGTRTPSSSIYASGSV